MNPLYDILNTNYITQQAKQQHHSEQVKQVQEAAKALKDFLDGCDKIEPEYQSDANAEFCAILLNYINRHMN
ncbi:MAG: hypothetical protein LUH36_09155 [Oscillospiraceae bacterium]|nr:hypothetical protein [Oscillospiraceae bacterium]